MDIISILGLVLGLAVLIMMGFKGWGMIPTSIVGALVVVITNRMDLWEALSTHYGTFMKNYAGDYFLMFFLGTLFGALMGSSGAAKSIACKIVDLMGSKRALLIVVITSAVLSYGGVSFAVVVFTLYPIALVQGGQRLQAAVPCGAVRRLCLLHHGGPAGQPTDPEYHAH